MQRVTVVVNNHSLDFSNYKEALVYVMDLAVSHHKYAPFLTLKENVCEACELVSEFLNIYADNHNELTKTEKSSLRRVSTRFLSSKKFLDKAKNTQVLLTSWYDMILAFEGNGLLPGFGFGSKAYKETVIGNPEKTSVTRTIR